MIPERERNIGNRLRLFREKLLIPRTRFAVTVGFGNERIASYEAGRAPLPYSVFKAISKHFAVNPAWLAEGIGEPQTTPISDEAFASRLTRLALFSEVYDQFIPHGEELDRARCELDIKRTVGFLRRFSDTINDESKLKRIHPETIRFVQTSLMRLSQAQLAFDTEWRAAFVSDDQKKKR